MTSATITTHAAPGEAEYRKRIRAWTIYDWANSAFATTILAAVLPVYYSQVAGAALPSAATATAYWSTGLSVSLLISALFSPILGTISDVMRGKKLFLSVFAGLGILATGLLVLVDTGDWILASILFIFGRIGFNSSLVFYDALLPHVAKEEDRDIVSARGYAMGYLGGGLLLAINILMIQLLPGTWGPRLSFLSVALWWAIFSIPVLRIVPEPEAAAQRAPGVSVVSTSFRRLWETLSDVRQYKDLFKFLLAFLIYNDGIGTIIGVAAIYGAELGFGSVELILALLLVQFVGIPYSLIFGRLPSKSEKRRAFFLAFVLFNLVALPVVGILGARVLPTEWIGGPPTPFADSASAVGQGLYPAGSRSIEYEGAWELLELTPDEVGGEDPLTYSTASQSGARLDFPFNGQKVRIIYSAGPDHGSWGVEIDGVPLLDETTDNPLINGYSETVRYGLTKTFEAEQAGEHVLTLVNLGKVNPESQGSRMAIGSLEVLPPARQSNLVMIIGIIAGVEVIGLALSALLGRPLFSRLVETLDTRRTVILSLAVYAVIAVWGFFLDSVIEFWVLAWMVAVVQGGSQALSRSLFASMSPASKSGEFFGLFGIMEKFSTIFGPLVFVAAVSVFGSSRPAVLSIIAFFIVGGLLLTRVNVEEGRRVARAEDAEFNEEASGIAG